jgi:ATP-dependent Clp protease adaptor protein ClpS
LKQEYGSMGAPHRQQEGSVVTEQQQQVKKPSLYKVLLHNDDYTTMDFVVMILEAVFHKNPSEANRIMMQVHRKGVGIAGVYPRDVAETKVVLVHDLARKNEYPLKCSIERE